MVNFRNILIGLVLSIFIFSCKRKVEAPIEKANYKPVKVERVEKEEIIEYPDWLNVASDTDTFYNCTNPRKGFFRVFYEFSVNKLVLFGSFHSSESTNLLTFFIYDCVNDSIILAADEMASSFELLESKESIKFKVHAHLPDSTFEESGCEFIELTISEVNGKLDFQSEMLYNPPFISLSETDSLIKIFENRPYRADTANYDESVVTDWKYLNKIVVCYLNGNEKCKYIFNNYNEKVGLDGAYAESYHCYKYLLDLTEMQNH